MFCTFVKPYCQLGFLALLINTQSDLFIFAYYFRSFVCCFYYVAMETVAAWAIMNTNCQWNKNGETTPFGDGIQ